MKSTSSPSARSRRSALLAGLGVLVALAAVIGSVVARWPTEASGMMLESPTAEAMAEADAGTLLLDLDDDVDPDVAHAIAHELDDAVAPYEWPDGSLGAVVSRAARLYRLRVPASERAEVLDALRGDEGVEAIEREHFVSLSPIDRQPPASAIDLDTGAGDAAREEPAPGAFRPNDPLYRFQWHMDQIQMPEAWARTRGRGAVVAVIDTGVLYRDHGQARRVPDLAPDRFVPGWDFVERDDTPDDEHGHGTHVAGTVAQTTHNSVGVTGVAPDARIMPIRVLDAAGRGRSGDISAAIRWAADHGADVINLSLGGGLPSATMAGAIRYAHRKGVTVIAAAGNTGRARVAYPAAYPHVIAVGAVRFDGTRAFYSSYGSRLDISAPGGDLRVDQNGDGAPDGVVQNTMVRGDPARHDYLGFQGTSMASPHVAGAAALLVAEGLRDPDAIEARLTGSADAQAASSEYGAGIIRVGDALSGLAAERSGRGAFAGFLALAVLAFRRRRREIAAAPIALGAAALGGGAAVLAWIHPALDGATWLGPQALGALGPWGALFGWSFVIPLVVIGMGAGARRTRAFAVSVAFAFAGFLAVEALQPTSDLAFLPFILEGPFLLLSAFVAAWLGWAAAQR